MAGLSGYLTGQLANPSWGGMLSQNVQGGMQGIADTMAAKRQKNSTDSMLTMLTQFDPNDPNVLRSVEAVGRQTNQDPLAVQKLIQDQQQQARVKQEMADQQKRMKWAESTNAWQEKLRKQAEGEQNASAAIVSAYNKDPSSAQAVLEALPAEFQSAGMDTITKMTQYKTAMTGAAEEAQMADGLSADTLAYMRSLGPTGERIASQYESTKGEGKRAAAARALGLVDNYMNNLGFLESGRGSSAASGKELQPNDGDILRAKEFIKGVDLTGDESLLNTLPWNFTNGIPEEYSDFIAVDLAKVKKNNPEFVPTPEWVQTQVDKYVKGEATPGGSTVIPTVTTKAEYDALPSGTEFIENGQKYTKP